MPIPNRSARVAFGVVLALALGAWRAPLLAQQWTVEQLRDRCQGFHEPGVLPRLSQIADLVAHQDQAFPAICVTIQGDHREYQLRIEKLLDQLADDRWLAREDAERTLIEIGGRALQQIQDRADSGKTLEEKIRARRVLEAIAARGTEAEEAETRILRGLTAAASYLRPDPRLERALVSALDHPDQMVRENAALALGRAADADVAARLVELIHAGSAGDPERSAALAGLGRMAGAPALDAVRGLLKEADTLGPTEQAALVRELARRPDGGPVLDELGQGDGLLAQLARTARAASIDGAPETATFDLPLDVQLKAPFLGVTAAGFLVGEPVPGLDRAELVNADCNVVEFERPKVAPLATRLFLVQGSLIGGDLLGIDQNEVRLSSPEFGEIHLPRSIVQGIAIDPALDRMVGASTDHDRVRLREGGKLLDGRVLSLVQDKLHLEGADGKDQVIPLATVAGLMFQRPTQVTHDPELYTRVDLVNGDRLLSHVVAGGPAGLALVVPGIGGATVPISNVKRLESGLGGGAVWGFTLIADYSNNRVLEVDDQGREVFALEEVYGAWDAECLDNGNLLITEFALNRVVEVTRAGEEVWSFGDLRNPYDADRLPNGNTLIADTFGDRVIEVNHDGKIVWKLEGIVKKPYDADRLPNGNTLVADGRNDRVVEVDHDGNIVWEVDNLEGVHDADRLPNGNTLITQRTKHRVIEVDRSGNIVWEIDNLSSPSDADRLPNGHTLVAENGWVREFDRRGQVVWEVEVAWAVEVNRY